MCRTKHTRSCFELARNSSTGKQAVGIFMEWKKIKNEEKRDICPEELRPNNAKGSNHSQKKDCPKDGKTRGNDKRKDNGYAKKLRLSICSDEPVSSKSRQTSVKTRNTEVGISMSTAVVSIKDPKEKNKAWTESLSDNDYD